MFHRKDTTGVSSYIITAWDNDLEKWVCKNLKTRELAYTAMWKETIVDNLWKYLYE